MNRDRLAIIIEEIEFYFIKLDELKIKKESDIDDIKFFAASMIIFSIINKTIDLAEEMCRLKGRGNPIEYKDLFINLEYAKIISKEEVSKLSDLIRMRNKFAHRYELISRKTILEGMSSLSIVRSFIKKIEKEMGI
jgi:uncharacterized protein YutE (UPF0331/DUF86 family)